MDSKDAAEIMTVIARTRRAMPRNMDVMEICKLAENHILHCGARTDRIIGPNSTAPANNPVKPRPLTRAEIQKNYRLRKKAKAR